MGLLVCADKTSGRGGLGSCGGHRQDCEGDAACSVTRGGSLNFVRSSRAHRGAAHSGERSASQPRRIEDPFPPWPRGRLDIACFSEKVAGLDQCLTTVEVHIGMLPERDAELQTL
ncbi:hypothetical protein NDU88_005594 [Pleurodeles waltl]|uniref:Uncharacterized protein n=1 Tax=Pleurodeles waltl TaxID=8319 RepID=A0AAV7SMB5_PLEWA|nr:hypothetical protein NDU88_005594 [Pleurodeles waltl]